MYIVHTSLHSLTVIYVMQSAWECFNTIPLTESFSYTKGHYVSSALRILIWDSAETVCQPQFLSVVSIFRIILGHVLIYPASFTSGYIFSAGACRLSVSAWAVYTLNLHMEHIGKQVRVVLKDDSRFDGFVHSMDTGTGKLTLHKGKDARCLDQISLIHCNM